MGTLTVLLPWLALLLHLQAASASSKAKPGCLGTCGDIEVPYPFGLRLDCSHGNGFNLTCSESVVPHKLMWGGLQVFNLSVERGEMTISLPISYDCYRGGRQMTNQSAYYDTYLIENSTFTFSSKNRFTTIGRDTSGLFSGSWGKSFTAGCITYCDNLSSLDANNSSCDGFGCCQTAIPKGVRRANIKFSSFNNYNFSQSVNDLNCGYAFLVEENNFTFYPQIDLKADHLLRRRPSMPVLVDWAIGNEGDTCKTSTGEKGTVGSGCLAKHSECINSTAGYGYRCNCSKGYHGNPYLENDGCQEIKEHDLDRLAYKAVATCVSIMFLLLGVGRLVVRFNLMPKWVIDAIKKESNQKKPDSSSSTGEDMRRNTKKKRYPVVEEEYLQAAKKCKKTLRTLIAENRCAPIMLCLAWQDVNAKTGKPFGSITHQFADEDINKVVDLFAKLEREHHFDKLSNADICQLAGVIAVEVAGGPDVAFHPGREDNAKNTRHHVTIDIYVRELLIDSSLSLSVGGPDVAFHPGREDNAKNMPPHDIETKDSIVKYLTKVPIDDSRLNLCVHDIAAISPWLRCNKDCSGFQFTWPPTRPPNWPLTLDNSYFEQLIPVIDEEKSLSDDDNAHLSEFIDFVRKYAKDEASFVAAYAKSHLKLSELGFADAD